MVATIAKLKLLLLKNSLKRSPWQIVGLIIGLLYGLSVAVLLIAALVASRWLDVEYRELILVLGGSVLVLLWWIIPLLTSTLDQTVDVSRFTSLPIPRRDLLVGSAVSGLIGVPGLFTVLILLGSWVTWSTEVSSFVVAIIGSALVLLMTQFGARLLTTLASGVWSSRRGRELMGIVLILAMIMLWPAFTILIELVSDINDIDAILAQLSAAAGVAGWLPFGAPWSAAVDAAEGNLLFAAIKLVISAVFVVLLAMIWSKLLDHVLTNPPSEKILDKKSAGFLDSRANGSISGIVVKTLRYWRRDNRLAVSNLVIILVPIVAILFGLFGREIFDVDDTLLASIGVIVAAIYGWGTHNMLAYDGSAFWMQLSSGLVGWRDRIGRLIAEGGVGVIFVLITVAVGIAITGRLDLIWVQLGTALGVLFAGLAVSTVVSTLWIYAVPAAGDNPFNTPSGAGGLMMLAQFASLAATFVLSLPSLLLFAVVLFVPDAPEWLGAASLIVGVGLGAFWLWLSVRIGGRQIDRRGPEILLQIQKFS